MPATRRPDAVAAPAIGAPPGAPAVRIARRRPVRSTAPDGPLARAARRAALRAARGPVRGAVRELTRVAALGARGAAGTLGATRWPWGVGAVVAAGALAPAAGVETVASPTAAGGALAEASLALPAGYVALSPLGRLLDALSLSSCPQLAALGLTVLVLFAGWRVARARRRPAPRCPIAELVALAGLVAVAAVALAATALLPRPMASLALADPDLVRVDVHAHTAASHDAPRWLTAERRRAWHAAAGYDVGFVADHGSVAGAVAAAAANPRRAGDGVSLLPALEGWLGDVHAVVLGITPADTGLLRDANVTRTLPALLRDGRLPSGSRPVTILPLPDDVLPVLDAAVGDGALAVRAVEVADGAPRALGQRDREGAALDSAAARHGLLPVAASNHHGWGRTAVAWTVVRVPGWRALTPEALGAAIVDRLRARDAAAVAVVARARPVATGRGLAAWPSLALTAPRLAWTTVRALHSAERVSWVGWAVVAAALRGAVGALRAARARTRGRRAARERRAVARAFGGREAIVGGVLAA